MADTVTGHGLTGVADAGAFLARLVRIDPAAVVRLRPAGDHTVLWARLPWRVLVTRAVGGAGPAADATVAAAELLAVLESGGDALPPRRDAQWRWPVPAGAGRVVESLAAAEVARLAAAAASALREAAAQPAAGRALGERAVRDALLDHVPIVVTGDAAAGRVEVSQRLVQAVARMGFLGPASTGDDGRVQVRQHGGWTGLFAQYGAAWLQRVGGLMVTPTRTRTNG